MLYRFLLLSDEVENFRREIVIDSEATFFDLHDVILDSVGFTKDQMTSFFICSDDWTKLTEITLVEMDTSSDQDNYIMEKTLLSDALEEEQQKLMYVFEYLTERAFYMELREIIPGKNLEKPKCIKSVGDAPAQISSFDDFEATLNQEGNFDDNFFYGDEEFDQDELDTGFSGLNEDSENLYDDSF